MVPRLEVNIARDSDLLCNGFNYSSTLLVSEGTHAKIFKLQQQTERLSDLYADIFGGAANNDHEEIKKIRKYFQGAYDKLNSTLGNGTAQLYLDERSKRLQEFAPKAINIRNKLDQVWAWGNVVKEVASKTAAGFMLVQDTKEFKFYFGTRSKSAAIKTHLQDPYSIRFSNFVLKGMPLALSVAWGTEKVIKKVFDWFPPEHFSGLEDSRKNIAEMAEDFRQRSKDAKNTWDDSAVVTALVREYGEDGHQFLKSLMIETDRSAYNYMVALQRKPTKFMQADEQMAESGVTSASLQLMYALLEEARFLHTFGKNNQPVVEKLDTDPEFPNTRVLLKAKDSSKGDAQPSSRARHNGREKVNFNSIEHWDYNSNWPETLKYLEKKANELSRSNSPTIQKEVAEYLKGAKAGDARCMALLALHCVNGTFRISNSSEVFRIAKQLYTPAASQGDPDAQYCLGLLHKGRADQLGEYTQTGENTQSAVDWLTKAAEQGHVEAKKNLEQMRTSRRSV